MVHSSLNLNTGGEVNPELHDLLNKGNAAAIFEALGKRGDVDPAIHSLVAGARCFGPAFTIMAHPYYSHGISSAVSLAPAGAVVVIDVGVNGETCALGGTIARAAQMRGVAGCFTNGRVRDISEIRELSFPVFARGTMLRSSKKGNDVECDVPVILGGQIVKPGDLVFGDDDGVVVIPVTSFKYLQVNLKKRLMFEEEADARVRAGEPYATVVANRPVLTR